MRTHFAGWVVLAAAVGLAGCADDKTGDVSGSVLVDGQPAGEGSVTFIAADGKAPTTGGEIKDGKYAVRVPVGTAKVEVRVPKVVGKKKLYNTPDSPVQVVKAEVLPEKYNDKTELRLDVQPGRNEKDWDLKSK